MTPQEYFDKCEKFNWHFRRTDDMGVYNKHFIKENELKIIANTSEKYRDIFNDIFWAFYEWGNKGGNKPELKNFIQEV